MKQRKPTATPALDADSQKSPVDAALLPGGPPGSLRVKAIAGICGIHLMACLGLTIFSATWWEDANLIRLQLLLQVIIGICCTAGAHRCFVHQAYEASMPLQLFYIFWVWASLTGSPVSWIKTHRTHHKHSDTELDPHNSHLGFWHSHFGWTFREPSNAIKREKVGVDLSCLPNLRMHQFVDRYYDPVGLALTFLIPSAVLHLSRGYINAWGMFWTTWVRLMVGINMAACVNSLAHTFGSRPHNQWIEARNNWIVSFCTWGEGWHNYHHAFPKDYRASGYDNFVLYWCALPRMCRLVSLVTVLLLAQEPGARLYSTDGISRAGI